MSKQQGNKGKQSFSGKGKQKSNFGKDVGKGKRRTEAHDLVTMSFKDFEKITGQKCLCCSSILCKNNWAVSKHIIDIKHEFQKIFDLRFRISQRFWAKRIASRLLVEDIPLDDFL